jgi:hypothetical protein
MFCCHTSGVHQTTCWCAAGHTDATTPFAMRCIGTSGLRNHLHDKPVHDKLQAVLMLEALAGVTQACTGRLVLAPYLH